MFIICETLWECNNEFFVDEDSGWRRKIRSGSNIPITRDPIQGVSLSKLERGYVERTLLVHFQACDHNRESLPNLRQDEHQRLGLGIRYRICFRNNFY